jgi:acetyl-CoA C-acetyltransferase
MAEAFIYDHVRTPRGRGRPDGALHEITPVQLAAQTLQALRDRSELQISGVEDVIFGCVSPHGEQGAVLPRIAALVAGYPTTVAGQQINRFCSSGLDAVNSAAALVMCGQAEAAIGGGVESMSRVPMGSGGGAWFADPAVAFQTRYVPQGISADLLATIGGFQRAELDRYAVESHRRAANAAAAGHFAASTVQIRDILGRIVLERDEHVRPDSTVEGLSKLKPSFQELGERGGFDAVALLQYPQVERVEHLHTAGNSSGIVDGAAAVLVGSRRFGVQAGLRPRARVRAFATVGSEPVIMLTGPMLVTEKLLKRAKMNISDIDLFEVNEAFAAVPLAFMQHFNLPPDRVNVNGGAIAMGHPLGATGAMLLGTVLDELERRNLATALITLCVGAGMGTATLIEGV